MRIITVNIGKTKIEFFNNMWNGYESIFVNGKLVSKKFSFFGVDHKFEVEEDGEWVAYVLTTGFGMEGITADLSRNGIPLLKKGKTGLELSIDKSGARSYRSEELV